MHLWIENIFKFCDVLVDFEVSFLLPADFVSFNEPVVQIDVETLHFEDETELKVLNFKWKTLWKWN